MTRPATTELDSTTADVLVVDDDDAFRESILEWLQQEGLITIAAAGGAEALRLARDRRPRVILLDLEMPGLTGWQFLDRRRTDRTLAAIPVIVVSESPPALAERFELAGELQKPLDRERLRELLRPLVRGSSAAEASPVLLVVEDDDDTRESVSGLLADHGYQVVHVPNGQEAEAYLLGNARPACIVLDLWMPVMDGWRFTTRLQQLGLPPIPMVVITAAEPHWGYPVPVAQVLRKPLHPETFLGMIGKLVPPPDLARSIAAAGSRRR